MRGAIFPDGPHRRQGGGRLRSSACCRAVNGGETPADGSIATGLDRSVAANGAIAISRLRPGAMWKVGAANPQARDVQRARSCDRTMILGRVSGETGTVKDETRNKWRVGIPSAGNRLQCECSAAGGATDSPLLPGTASSGARAKRFPPPLTLRPAAPEPGPVMSGLVGRFPPPPGEVPALPSRTGASPSSFGAAKFARRAGGRASTVTAAADPSPPGRPQHARRRGSVLAPG